MNPNYELEALKIIADLVDTIEYLHSVEILVADFVKPQEANIYKNKKRQESLERKLDSIYPPKYSESLTVIKDVYQDYRASVEDYYKASQLPSTYEYEEIKLRCETLLIFNKAVLYNIFSDYKYRQETGKNIPYGIVTNPKPLSIKSKFMDITTRLEYDYNEYIEPLLSKLSIIADGINSNLGLSVNTLLASIKDVKSSIDFTNKIFRELDDKNFKDFHKNNKNK